MSEKDRKDTQCCSEASEQRLRLRALILSETAVVTPPLTPELRIHGAADFTTIWSATEARLEQMALPPPFWAFAWAGGQALARWLLDNPEEARDRSVLSIGAGCGLEAVAAARAGARRVVANDIDVAALAAAEENAALNGVTIETEATDLLTGDALPPADLILAGDVFYEKSLSETLERMLRRAAAAGAVVRIGDPDRNYAPTTRLRPLAEYRVPVPMALEDVSERRARVYALDPPETPAL